MKTIICSKCGCRYNANHDVCPYCGEPRINDGIIPNDNNIDTNELVNDAIALYRFGDDHDELEAINMLKQAASLGNAASMYLMGLFYARGSKHIITKDASKMVYCMNKAIKYGSKDAKLFVINNMINNKYGYSVDKTVINNILSTMTYSDFYHDFSILVYMKQFGDIILKDRVLKDIDENDLYKAYKQDLKQKSDTKKSLKHVSPIFDNNVNGYNYFKEEELNISKPNQAGEYLKDEKE